MCVWMSSYPQCSVHVGTMWLVTSVQRNLINAQFADSLSVMCNMSILSFEWTHHSLSLSSKTEKRTLCTRSIFAS